MNYGMNLLLWTAHVTEEHLPLCEKLKSMGFDGVELPMFEMEPAHYERLGKKLDDLGLERTAVTVRTATDNPISPDANTRAAGLEANCRAIDCCAAAGVQMLVGPIHSALGEFTGKIPTADEWKWGVEGIRKAAEYAATHKVMLGIEALNRFECYFLNCMGDLARFVEEVDHPHCRLMYDTFHANIEEKSPRDAIHAVQKDLGHVHISENDRSTPGAGNVRWQETFDTLKEIGYDGWLTIEAFGLALPELSAATKIWRRMYHDEMQLARDGLAFMKSQWSN
jgi:D-psicose/D-tagatose/L-ribulose 3-epimerase